MNPLLNQVCTEHSRPGNTPTSCHHISSWRLIRFYYCCAVFHRLLDLYYIIFNHNSKKKWRYEVYQVILKWNITSDIVVTKRYAGWHQQCCRWNPHVCRRGKNLFSYCISIKSRVMKNLNSNKITSFSYLSDWQKFLF